MHTVPVSLGAEWDWLCPLTVLVKLSWIKDAYCQLPTLEYADSQRSGGQRLMTVPFEASYPRKAQRKGFIAWLWDDGPQPGQGFPCHSPALKVEPL